MKRIITILLLLLVAGYLAYICVSLSLMPPLSDLANKRYTVTIQVKDWHGQYHPFVVGSKNRYWTPSGRIPPEMKWAVILAEDSNFYKHEGFDVKAIKEAIKYDLEKKSFARGPLRSLSKRQKIFFSPEKRLFLVS